MHIGILEIAAIEEWKRHRPAQPDSGHYGVYFRHEYFGRVPGHLLPAVREAMAAAGGFEYRPDARTITALHQPPLYAGMCREIVALVRDWMNEEIILAD